MAKYDSLKMYLSNLLPAQNEITLPFKKIEEIIHDKLPKSAHIHRAWWSNEKNGVHVSAHAWMDAGWKVDTVNQSEDWVRFVRQRPASHLLDDRNKHYDVQPVGLNQIPSTCGDYQTYVKKVSPDQEAKSMLEKAFLDDVERAIALYESLSGHAATRTRPMIEKLGAVEALSTLMVSPDLQQGFKVLRDSDRLDKSFEAIVVRYEHHFRPEVVEAAKWRLDHPNDLLEY